MLSDKKNVLQWFPMRVTYCRELKIKQHLDKIGIESFLPMRHSVIDKTDGTRKMVLVPTIHNLIFVHSTKDELTSLKMTDRTVNTLRYIIKSSSTKINHEILVVPEKQMENFIKVTQQEDKTLFLDDIDVNMTGKKVKITDGFFAGIEGILKRIKKNKRVVVKIEGIAAVAIAHIPSKYISIIDD